MKRWHVMVGVGLLASCSNNPGGGVPATSDASIAADSANVSDASSTADGGFPSRTQFCSGSGPLLVATERGQECAGNIAERTFRYGICSCGSLAVANDFTVDSIDSTMGQMTLAAGAPVGINGDFEVNNTAQVGGSTTVAGQIRGANVMTFGGDVATGAGIQVGNRLQIARDLRSGGAVSALNGTVGRDLTTNATVAGVTAARVISQAVQVDSPCECAPSRLLDIGSAVTHAQSQNHNAESGINANLLAQVAASASLHLECGITYLSSIHVANGLTIRVTGRNALFVGADFMVNNSLEISLDAGAELDIFVGGNFSMGNSVQVGDPQRPAATRFYVGGAQTIAVSNSANFSANLYAPRANVSVANALHLRGSVFAGQLLVGNSFHLTYDRAILESQCEDPPAGGQCTDCNSCGGNACRDGMCTTCQGDGDCCPNLTCQSGMCVPLLI